MTAPATRAVSHTDATREPQPSPAVAQHNSRAHESTHDINLEKQAENTKRTLALAPHAQATRGPQPPSAVRAPASATTLGDRLRHAVAIHAEATSGSQPPSAVHARADAPIPPPARPPAADALAAILRADWHDTPAGTVFVRDDWYPLDHLHGTATLGCALDLDAATLSLLATGGDAPHASRLAFFDIETTGLSGGTGTYIVLAGLGSYESASPGAPPAFRMRQYFLADVAQERAMLELLAADLARFQGIVTYNGRTFDVPFLQTRLALARLRSPLDAMPHLDLLHPLRRLYKHRLPACRLSDAERRLLRIERIDDVAGALIPQIYFDYVRAGRIAPLRAVFRHNAEDVLSLVGVLARLSRLLAGEGLDPDDGAAVARWWEAHGDESRAAWLYREALPWLEGGDDWPWAAARHARLCRRAGERAEAALLWWKLWEAGDHAAGLDLAKHLEHHARDYDAALAVARELRRRDASAALAHRIARLEARVRRRPAAPAPPDGQ